MASNRKKKPEEPAEEAKKIISAEDINLSELVSRLKEFESKALLDRLKVLERNVAMIQKAQTIDGGLLKEIKQHVSYLSLAHEELLNNLGGETYPESSEEPEESLADEKSDKKWN
jgi:hypothetical protein